MKLKFSKTEKEKETDFFGEIAFKNQNPEQIGVSRGMATYIGGDVEGINIYNSEDGPVGGAVAVILWKETETGKEYLLNKRSDYSSHAPGAWSITTGKAGVAKVPLGKFAHLKVPEEPLYAALREVEEETGIKSQKVLEISEMPSARGGNYPSNAAGEPASKKSIPLYANCYSMKVDPNVEIVKSEESEELKWVGEEEFYKTFLKEDAEPFSRAFLGYADGNRIEGCRLKSENRLVQYAEILK